MDDILVVGAGPTGLAAALFADECGVRVRIVDRAPHPSTQSKALGVNPRTLALLDASGVAARMLAAGHRALAINLWRGTRRLARLPFAAAGDQRPSMLVLSQARSEHLLTEALAERGIEVERGVALETLASHGPAAEALLRHADGSEETLAAPRLLAADGAHSVAREALGIGFDGDTFPEPWRLLEAEIDTPLARDEGHALLLEEGFVFLMRVTGEVWRVASNLTDPLALLPTGGSVGSVTWDSSFHVAHRSAQRLAAGRVCLAGDAAHLHSPLGARGMNLGIEDAWVWANLLGAGSVGDYPRLRKPVIDSVVARVKRATQMMRGQTRAARTARLLLPFMAPLLPLAAGPATRFVLGLDHAIGVDRWTPGDAETGSDT